MPNKIGVRELKTRASEIIREVRQHRTHYLVTYRGREVAVLLPVEEPSPDRPSPRDERRQTAWEELEKIGEEIGQSWLLSQNSVELLSKSRR